jgi:hypothetical protein
MAIEAYVISADIKAVGQIDLDGHKMLETLGPQEEAMAVHLKELFRSIADAISDGLEVESQVSVEVSGSISLKAQAGVKYLLFNVGAEANAMANMKVVLATTIKPKPSSDHS